MADVQTADANVHTETTTLQDGVATPVDGQNRPPETQIVKANWGPAHQNTSVDDVDGKRLPVHDPVVAAAVDQVRQAVVANGGSGGGAGEVPYNRIFCNTSKVTSFQAVNNGAGGSGVLKEISLYVAPTSARTLIQLFDSLAAPSADAGFMASILVNAGESVNGDLGDGLVFTAGIWVRITGPDGGTPRSDIALWGSLG